MLWPVRRESSHLPVSTSGGSVLCCPRMPITLSALCITDHVSPVPLRARSPPGLTVDRGLSRIDGTTDRFALVTCRFQTKGGITE
jgi:hypothetical protein